MRDISEDNAREIHAWWVGLKIAWWAKHGKKQRFSGAKIKDLDERHGIVWPMINGLGI